MPFSIVRNDISLMSAGVIVSVANEHPLARGGVRGAIFKAAGPAKLIAACEAVAPCPAGRTVSTPAFGLSARRIVHAVGPRLIDGAHDEEAPLRSTDASTLAESARLGAQSVSLPLISAGIFGYPSAAALAVACEEVRRFLASDAATVRGTEMRIYLVVFDRAALAASLDRFNEVAAYIDDEFVDARPPRDAGLDLLASAPLPQMPVCRSAAASPHVDKDEVAALLRGIDASFLQALLALIDARGLTDAEVYKRANISRQLFSKIRRDNGYRPTKQTAVALAMALRLELDETESLLARAGLALSPSAKFDVIVTYFIERGCYDIYELNAMFFAFDQPLLGSM